MSGDSNPKRYAGEVSYPEHLPEGILVNYNFKDTVNVEWVSWAANSSQTTMQIFWWQLALGETKLWRPLERITVPQNGSRAFKLDGVNDLGAGWYLGQWNLNFTREDNDPPTGLTLSQIFNCTFDSSLPARTFGKDVVAPPAASSGSTAAAPTQTDMTASGSSAVATSTPQPSDGALTPGSAADASSGNESALPAVVNHGISGGAIAGIVIGIIAALLLGAAGAFLFLQKRRVNTVQVLDNRGTQGPPPLPGYPSYVVSQNIAGAGPAVYADALKRPAGGLVSVSDAGFYAQDQPALPPTAQQPAFGELSAQETRRVAEMPTNRPWRQELPG